MELELLNLGELSQLFNDQLSDFLDQLQIIVDDLTEKSKINRSAKANIDFYKNLVQKCMALNKDLVVESYGCFIINENQMIDRIVNKDEDYFMTLNVGVLTNDSNIKELIEIIKSVIIYISESNKDIIFEYMHILCQVALAYAAKKYN